MRSRAIFVSWIFLLILGILMAASEAEKPPTSTVPSSPDWYHQAWKKIHFDMHTPGNILNVGQDFDADEFAKEIKNSGFDAVCFFAKCGYGWSYHPTKIGVMHPHLSYDLFGKGVAAMKKQNLKVIAYFGMQMAPEAVAKNHPDWYRIAPGAPLEIREQGGVYCCFFTRFVEDFMIPYVVEVNEKYPIDGFFLDCLPSIFVKDCDCAVCHADRTKAGFEKPMPLDPAYYQWRLNRIQQRCNMILDRLHEKCPNLSVGINFMSACRNSVTFPAAPHTGYLTADIVNPGDVLLYMDYELASTCWRPIPADTMQMRMLTNWQDWTTRTLETRICEAAVSISRGVPYFIGDLLSPQSLKLDEEIMSLHRQTNQFLDQRASVYGKARPTAEYAVLHDNYAYTLEPKTQDSGLGAFTALMDDGCTTHVLQKEDLSTELSHYRTLVIPHCPELSPEAVSAIQQFVKKGGSLVVLGSIPSQNREAFSSLLGVNFSGSHEFKNSYLFLKKSLLEASLREKIHALPPLSFEGSVDRVTLNKARMICALTGSQVYAGLKQRPPAAVTETVGISLNSYGKGEVIYSPISLSQDYWDRGNLHAKYLVQVLARFVTPSPLTFVESDATINTYTLRSGSELQVHLLHRVGESRPALPRLEEKLPAVHDIILKLNLPSPPLSVRLVPGETPLTWKNENGIYSIHLPPLKTHACCVIQTENPK